jgi:hypothetical protein
LSEKVFELFLSSNSIVDILSMFDIYQLATLILFSKTFDFSLLMFGHSPENIIRHTNI